MFYNNRMTEKELKALIFDVDGTLVDNEQDGHRVAFNLAFRDAGLDWYWDVDTYGQLLNVTGGKERIRYFIDRFGPALDPGVNWDEFIPVLHQSKTRHFVALMQSGAIPLRPGVERLLKEARACGLRLAIATTTSPQNVMALLATTLGDKSIAWFDVIAAGDVVPAKKPAPDIYIHALQKLGLSSSECVAFEDSENGLLSSLGAGVKTIVTVNGYTRGQNFNGALIVVDQLGEPGAGLTVLATDKAEVAHDLYINIKYIKQLFK